MQTLVIYESPAALYDVYHWIERFKDKIDYLNRLRSPATDNRGVYELYWDITLENREHLHIVSFNHLPHLTHAVADWDKVVVFGRIPREDEEIMTFFNKIISEQPFSGA